MATQYVVVAPSGESIVLAAQSWVQGQITNAQIADNTYADNSSQAALSLAQSYADGIVAARLAELLPVLPAPTPPPTGYGAIKQWRWFYPDDTTKREETDGEYLIYRDQKYIDAVGINAAINAVTQANAYTLVQTNSLVTTLTSSYETADENILANAKLYTDQTKSVLLDDISAAIAISELYTDNRCALTLTSAQTYTDYKISLIPAPITGVTGAVVGSAVNGIINTTLAPIQTISGTRFEIDWVKNSDGSSILANNSFNETFYESIEYNGDADITAGSYWLTEYDFLHDSCNFYYKLSPYLKGEFSAKTWDYYGWTVKNVHNPVDDQDAATKHYVDAQDITVKNYVDEQISTIGPMSIDQLIVMLDQL